MGKVLRGRSFNVFTRATVDPTTGEFKVVREEPYAFTRSTRGIQEWEDFIKEVMLQEYPGYAVMIRILKGNRFPKVAERFGGQVWEWHLPSLRHRLTLGDVPDYTQVLFMRREGKTCRYFIGTQDLKGTKFELNNDKLPILPRSPTIIK